MASYTKGKLKATPIKTIVNAKTGKQFATLTKGGRSERELTEIAHRFVLCWNNYDEVLKQRDELMETLQAIGKAEKSWNNFDDLLEACKETNKCLFLILNWFKGEQKLNGHGVCHIIKSIENLIEKNDRAIARAEIDILWF